MGQSTSQTFDGTDKRSLVTRWRERLHYGLLTQEVLDRLNRFGILFYPYYLNLETTTDGSALDVPASVTFAEIERDRAGLVATLSCRPHPLEVVTRRMERAKCFGAFEDGQLVGYTWCYFSHVPAVSGRDVLFELGDDAAYLFDMYVARPHRGRRLAVALRRWTSAELIRRGRRRLYSTTLVHNSAAMRFKRRLNVTAIEKRVGYGVRHVFGRDVRIKALIHGPLPTRPRIELPLWTHNPYGIT